ncbi:MAG TPA: AI-2E family transporter [Methanothrix sp.]|nr:AI-2E family transporter [Methanothrix sp.]
MDQRRRFCIIFAAIIFVLVIFAIYISKDFISTILLSFLMAYILDPVFMYLSRNIGNHRRASALASILIIFFILIFVIFAAADALITEMSNLLGLGGIAYLQIQASNFSIAINDLSEMYLPTLAANYVKGIGDIPTALIIMVQPILQDRIMSFASNLPIYFTQFLLAIIFTYYFLVDGRRIIEEFKELITEKELTTHLLVELNLIYKSLFRVFFLNSLLIGITGALGFLLLGVPYPLLWGMIIAVVALVPMVGPELIFGPIAIYYLLTQEYTTGIALLAFGIIFLTVIPNNFVLPRLASASASIHPLITLMAFTAPVFVIGIVGVIVGPAVYGFILAAYRTMIYFRKVTSNTNAKATQKTD